ncbi:MAG TPA: PEP-CTERM sorting domain-containing protein [Burkholderiales bacterium]|nr:PEP-CTERM sorting domain-containing protein [Burkholderiales bacterium]
MKNVKLLAAALSMMAVGAPAHAGTIKLWMSSTAKPAPYASYTTGTSQDPAGPNNKYWQWNVADSEYPQYGTFQIKASGYATANDNGTGAFSQRDVERYDGGLGICDDTSCSSPQHSMDNDGKNDLIVIDLGVGHEYKPVKFSIGWEYYSGCDSTHTSNSCPDIEAWVGNSFNPALGWAGITGSWTRVLNGNPQNNIQPDKDYNFGSGSGRYLVIAPQTGSEECVAFSKSGSCTSWQYDYFKLQSLVLEKDTDVPEPSALALAGLTGAALLAARRRRRSH